MKVTGLLTWQFPPDSKVPWARLQLGNWRLTRVALGRVYWMEHQERLYTLLRYLAGRAE